MYLFKRCANHSSVIFLANARLAKDDITLLSLRYDVYELKPALFVAAIFVFVSLNGVTADSPADLQFLADTTTFLEKADDYVATVNGTARVYELATKIGNVTQEMLAAAGALIRDMSRLDLAYIAVRDSAARTEAGRCNDQSAL